MISEESTWMPNSGIFNRALDQIAAEPEVHAPRLRSVLGESESRANFCDVQELNSFDFRLLITAAQRAFDREVEKEKGQWAERWDYFWQFSELRGMLQADPRAEDPKRRVGGTTFNNWVVPGWVFDCILEHLAFSCPPLEDEELIRALLAARTYAGSGVLDPRGWKATRFNKLILATDHVFARLVHIRRRHSHDPVYYSEMTKYLAELNRDIWYNYDQPPS